MKIFLKASILGLCLQTLNPATAQIPTAGFEEWKTLSIGSYSVSDPKGWTSSNLFSRMNGYTGPLGIVKTTDAHGGQNAVLIRTITDNSGKKEAGFLNSGEPDFLSGEMNDKFKITGNPTTLKGFYKYQSNSRDIFFINMVFYKNGEPVGTAGFTDSVSKSMYTPFSVPVIIEGSVIPDSASISVMVGLSESQIVDASLYLDDLSLGYENTGVSDLQSGNLQVKVYPNPATENVFIDFEQKTPGFVTAKVRDITGKEIAAICNDKQYAGGKHLLEWDASGVPAGIYFIQVYQQSAHKTIKVLIN
ncbi:MAG: T9SS type A sorting domain-containing protein [Bacteroidota bacterium]|nr:T9SS type A sorting domain-containing protein [Bacteroidota bacterium]